MQNKIDNFHLLTKKKTKINQEDAKAATALLFEIYQESQDAAFLAEHLVSSGHIVSSTFSQKYISKLSQDEIIALRTGLLAHLNSREIPLASILPVLFSIVAYGVTASQYKESFLPLFNALISFCDVNETFSNGNSKILREHLLYKCKGQILTLDYSQWKDSNRKRLYRFLCTAFANEDVYATTPYMSTIEDWATKYGFAPINPKVKPTPIIPPAKPSTKTSVSIPAAEEVAPQNSINTIQIDEIAAANFMKEMQTLYQNIFVKNNAYLQFEESLARRDSEISSLQKELTSITALLHQANERCTQLNRSLEEKDTQVSALEERLKVSFSFDESKNNQALLTLKKDIGASLKLHYSDYMELSDSEASEDNYHFFKITLAQIFKSLKRYDIEF